MAKLGPPPITQMELAAAVEIGPIGRVSVHGIVGNNPLPYYDITGSVCVGLFGFGFSGTVRVCAGGGTCPAALLYGFELHAGLGFLGSITFAGEISFPPFPDSGSVLPRMKAKAIAEFSIGDFLKGIVNFIIGTIAGTTDVENNLVAKAMGWIFDGLNIIKRVELSYDSQVVTAAASNPAAFNGRTSLLKAAPPGSAVNGCHLC